MALDNKKIGVFDSGYGGLTVLKEILSILPDFNYVYLGDTARAPYGHLSREKVLEYSKQAVDFLFAQDCELIIFACNTASAEALRKIQQEYLPNKYPKKRVLGVIIPAAEYIFENHTPQKVGVIGTVGTIESGTYVAEIKKIDSKVEVFQNACPMLVPLIEAGKTSGVEVDEYLKIYLSPLLVQKIDTLILGCTHYALLEPEIKKVVNKNIKIINQSLVVAKKVQDYLSRHPEIEKTLAQNSQVAYFTTGKKETFAEFGSKIMGKKIDPDEIKIS